MNLKDKILSMKDKVHSIVIEEETYYYKHFKQYHQDIIQGKKDAELEAAIFSLVLCDVNGEPVFTLEDIEDIKGLPQSLVKAVNYPAITGMNTKKP